MVLLLFLGLHSNFSMLNFLALKFIGLWIFNCTFPDIFLVDAIDYFQLWCDTLLLSVSSIGNGCDPFIVTFAAAFLILLISH